MEMTRMFRRLLAVLLSAAALAANAGGPIAVCSDGTPIKLPGAGTMQLNLDRGDLGARTNAQVAAIVDNATVVWNGIPWSSAGVYRGPDLPMDVTAANYGG